MANSGPMIQKLFRGLRIIGRDLNIRVDPPTKSDRPSFLLFVNPLIELRRILVGTENFNNKTIRPLLSNIFVFQFINVYVNIFFQKSTLLDGYVNDQNRKWIIIPIIVRFQRES